MKKQLKHLRRFFARTSAKKLNATVASREAMETYEDDESDTRLSGAFIGVLLLHIIAIVGIFAFSRVKENTPLVIRKKQDSPTETPNLINSQKPPLQAVPERILAPLPVSSSTRSHIVKTGDTLTKIALAWGVSPAAIVAQNKLDDRDEIRVGQTLSIPEPSLTPAITPPRVPEKVEMPQPPSSVPKSTTKPAAHIVKKGETLIKIAREANVSYESLIKANKIKDPRKIQIGQKLIIPH